MTGGRSTRTRDLVLGLFFFGTMAMLLWVTTFLMDFKPGGRPRLEVLLSDAQGIAPGDPVLVLGVRSGRVQEIVLEPSGGPGARVRVRADLDDSIVLRDGYRIAVEESTLLGGRVLSVDPGPPSARVSGESVFRGESFGSPLADFARWFQANEDALSEVVSSVKEIAADIEQGDGVLGMLIRDGAMGEDFGAAVSDLRETLASARVSAERLEAGEGLLGRLLTDEDMAEDARRAVSDMAEAAAELKGITDDLGAASADAREVAARLERGEGTLGRLLASEEVYEEVRLAAADLAGAAARAREVMDQVAEGRGTLGRLIMEEDLYADLQNLVRVLGRSVEDAREAAPVTTFTSLLFGAF